jgi:hypothetical protein
MTDSPSPGLSTAGATGDWSVHLTRAPETSEPAQSLLRPEQRAPSGAGVKDLRPLRGRPFGSIPDPDASPRRAQEQAENDKEKINSTN